MDEAVVTQEIVALVTEKTGYPAEMLELDLDMEADLGIDTVKQAELIGMIREKYDIAKSENLSLKDYPTLRHVVRFVMTSGSPHPNPLPHAGEGAKAPAAAQSLPLPRAGEGGVRVEGPEDLGPLPELPLFDTVLSANGNGTKTGKTFSLESDPWLKDHAISGTPYVAGVMGLELFVETAAKKLGKAPAALADVRFALPIKLLRQRPVTVRTVAGDSAEMRIESDFVSPQGIKLGAPRTHFTARVAGAAAGGDVEARARAFVKTLKGDQPVVPASAVYEAYFHGPRFQVLAGILAVGETELVGLYRAPASPLWDKGGRGLVFQPMLIEAAFQTCGYRDLHVRKKMTLPDSIESVRVYDRGAAPKELLVYARWRGPVDGGDGADRSLYDACVLERSGKVWASLTGYRMIAVS